jgi:hypothetical protein
MTTALPFLEGDLEGEVGFERPFILGGGSGSFDGTWIWPTSDAVGREMGISAEATRGRPTSEATRR